MRCSLFTHRMESVLLEMLHLTRQQQPRQQYRQAPPPPAAPQQEAPQMPEEPPYEPVEGIDDDIPF